MPSTPIREEQTMITFTVTSMKRAERTLALGRSVDIKGWDARVDAYEETIDGSSRKHVAKLNVDRIDGESEWHIWAEFKGGSSCPRFMNGLFSRCTVPFYAVPELAEALDAEAAR